MGHRIPPRPIPWGRSGRGKEIPYETLRGLPLGHPPFFAFLALAATLSGLFDAPPSLPICEHHSRTAGGGSSFVFIVLPLVCPCHQDDGAGVLDEAFKTISEIPPYWLSAWMHEHCPEWKGPKGSSAAIDPAEILKAEKKPKAEIEEIEDEVNSLHAMDAVLHR